MAENGCTVGKDPQVVIATASSDPAPQASTSAASPLQSLQQPRSSGSAAALQAAWGLSRHFWWDASRSVRAEATLRLALVVAVMLFRGRAGTFLSTERRKQVNTMLSAGGSDRGAILQGLLRYLGSLLLLSPINKVYWRLLRGLRQQWTGHLTTHFLTTFVDTQCLTYGGSSYSQSTGDHDASVPETLPDQHISRDVSIFVQLATSLSLETLQAFIHLYFYSKLLRSIAPSLSRIVVLAAVSGTLLARFLGRRLPEMYAEERHADGHFTYSLTRIRENAESIAFYQGHAQELQRMQHRLAARLSTEWTRLARKDVVQWFSATYRQLLGLVPAYLLAGRMLAPSSQAEASATAGNGHGHSHGHGGHGHSHSHGHGGGGAKLAGTDVGAVAQAREAFDEVLYHLLILAENTSDFSRLATVSLELYDRDLQSRSVLCAIRTKHDHDSRSLVLDDIPSEEDRAPSQDAPQPSPSCSSSSPTPPSRVNASSSSSWLQIRNLSLLAPGHPPRLLLKDLELSLAADSGGLLITGRSGAGKTTLLRAIAGIWLSGSGHISRVKDRRRVMFLPQKPYLQGGTLLEQVLYPNLVGCSDVGNVDTTKERQREREVQEVREALERVGLSKLLQRLEGDLGASRRWADELSLGEQQRLSVARILVNKPEFVILDEITSANDLQHEEALYRLIQSRCRSFISVGHRESLLKFHSQRLRLMGEDEGGLWNLEDL